MKLPEEVIANILKFLDYEELQQCLLVSHRIRHLILTSPIPMRKFVIVYNKFEDITEKTQFLTKYGYHVKHLIINCVDTYSDEQIGNVLKVVPNIESIYCFGNKRDYSDGSTIFSPDIKLLKLREAEFCAGSRPMNFLLKCLKKSSKLKFLKLDCQLNYDLGDEVLENLMGKEELGELILENVSLVGDGLKSNAQKNAKLNLTKLIIDNEENMVFSENFYEFLKSQAKNVKDLKLGFDEDYRCLELVVRNFNLVENLEINCDQVMAERIVNYLGNCQMKSVKKLKVFGEDLYMAELQTIMNLFPNVEALVSTEFRHASNFNYNEILLSLTKLTHLEFDETDPKSLINFEVPNLKFIQITSSYFIKYILSYEDFWTNFFNKCPIVETVIITLPVDTVFIRFPLHYTNVFAILNNILKGQNELGKLKTVKYEHLVDVFDVEIDLVENSRKIIIYKETRKNLVFSEDYDNFDIIIVDDSHRFYKQNI